MTIATTMTEGLVVVDRARRSRFVGRSCGVYSGETSDDGSFL